MTTVQPIENKYTALETEKTLPKNNSTKDDGNIFENFASIIIFYNSLLTHCVFSL